MSFDRAVMWITYNKAYLKPFEVKTFARWNVMVKHIRRELVSSGYARSWLT